MQFFGFGEQIFTGDPVRLEERHHVEGVAEGVVRDGVELHAFGGSEGVCSHAFGEKSREDARSIYAGARHFEDVAREEEARVDRKAGGQALEDIDGCGDAVIFDVADLREVYMCAGCEVRLRHFAKFAVGEDVRGKSFS